VKILTSDLATFSSSSFAVFLVFSFLKFGTLLQTSGRSDEVIAAETLENYKRCNNSFIQGIFQAQYRSSLSCSRCRTQSNTFDPFQCISVQLPQFSKQSIYVTVSNKPTTPPIGHHHRLSYIFQVLYTSQQPRQVQIGLSMPSGATVSELRDILESDTSIERANMLITEIGEAGFLRTFTDTQSVNIISEIDPIYCIEVAQLKDVEEDTTSAYILLCWINVADVGDGYRRFGEFTPPNRKILDEIPVDFGRGGKIFAIDRILFMTNLVFPTERRVSLNFRSTCSKLAFSSFPC
jgi:ubiquitin carboxyl-terminal hydrolase 31